MKKLIFLIFFFSTLCFANYANVVNVKTFGSSNTYKFSVSIQSPDIGCKQYANWWEILDENGTLLYRRILWHSHTKEQPVTRSGENLNISPTQIVYIRAHLNNKGYGGTVFKGSIQKGFSPITSIPKFPKSIENQAPQATECWF